LFIGTIACLAAPTKDAVCRTGRGEALCSGGWCAVQPESMVANITDGEGAIAGCGEQLADALLDLTGASGHR
jgi:hypothetical protein